jgi:hypothetical protein
LKRIEKKGRKGRRGDRSGGDRKNSPFEGGKGDVIKPYYFLQV